MVQIFNTASISYAYTCMSAFIFRLVFTPEGNPPRAFIEFTTCVNSLVKVSEMLIDLQQYKKSKPQKNDNNGFYFATFVIIVGL